jgi:hypothetical protein
VIRTELVKQGLLEVVLKVFKDVEDWDVKQECMWALAELSKSGTPAATDAEGSWT